MNIELTTRLTDGEGDGSADQDRDDDEKQADRMDKKAEPNSSGTEDGKKTGNQNQDSQAFGLADDSGKENAGDDWEQSNEHEENADGGSIKW
jgi:hypothetical protein